MDARHLENETFEVTNSDMQDSATVIVEVTPGIFIVTNNDNDSHGSELANAQKFAELDREVAELKEQISRVANNTSVQPNNPTLSDVSHVQPGQSAISTVSELCASNSSCMIESTEIGCSHGMNGNALSGNASSITHTQALNAHTTSGGQILPELSLPTFSS